MRLTEKALEAINTQTMRLRIAQTLPCSETWVRELIKANKDNGPLTTMAVITIIRKGTDLPDTEILEESDESEAVVAA